MTFKRKAVIQLDTQRVNLAAKPTKVQTSQLDAEQTFKTKQNSPLLPNITRQSQN